jgi:hypothetical protein
LNGIAGVVMGDLSPKLPPVQLATLQTIMTMTVFKAGTCEVNEFEQTAEALLQLTKFRSTVWGLWHRTGFGHRTDVKK